MKLRKTNQPITPTADQKPHHERFNPEHIIVLPDTDSLKKELKVLKREFKREEGKIEAPDVISLSGADVEIDLDRIPNFAGVPDADIRVPDGCTKTGRKVKCPHDKADDDGDIGIHVERDGKRERSVDVNVGRRGEGGGVNTPPRWKKTELDAMRLRLGLDEEGTIDLSNFAEDRQEKSEDLSYFILDGATESTIFNRDFIACNIQNKKEIKCTAKAKLATSENIFVRVKDKENLKAEPDAFVVIQGID